jgi:hypothetical protein
VLCLAIASYAFPETTLRKKWASGTAQMVLASLVEFCLRSIILTEEW